ncbi:glutamyl-tRNA reductase [Streptomyces sp. NPDC054933]
MTLLSIGTSHHSAPLAALEATALTTPDVIRLLDRLAGSPAVAEAVVLATCNRTELYADTEDADIALAHFVPALAEAGGADPADVRSMLRVRRRQTAAEHLFTVASGLDSLLVGDHQIRGQVRAAYNLAREHGTVGPVLHGLFQRALRAGKRVETETRLGGAASSLVAIALDAAAQLAGPLEGHRALVIGSGNLGSLSAVALHRAGLAEITVVNRTARAAERLAEELGVRTVAWAQLPEALCRAELVVSATGARNAVLTRDLVVDALAARPGSTKVLIDLALPRDIEPSVASLAGVRLIDLVRLETRLKEASERVPIAEAHRIVDAEARSYETERHRDAATPAIVAMRKSAMAVVDEEVDRLLHRVPTLPGQIRGEVEQTARRIAQKLIHRPTVRVREMATETGGHTYVEVLHDLFGPEPAGTAGSSNSNGGER